MAEDTVAIDFGISTAPSGDVPVFPLLQDHEAASALSAESAGAHGRGSIGRSGDDDNDDEPAVARPFVRTQSPDSAARAPAAMTIVDDNKVTDRLVYKMHKFSLYETASRYYIVGVDVSEKRYRILKIDRTTEGAELNMTDDKIVYSLKEMNQLLDTIDDGNRGTGGVKLRCTTWGLLGFIKFTGPYYMLLITKKSTVAMIGGHYVYQIEGTELVPLTPGRFKPDARNTEEQRFLGILNNLDLTKSFYYSYSYDVTRTLQHNICRERSALAKGMLPSSGEDLNSMFVWNDYLLQPATVALRDPYDWCCPIIHGYIDQAGMSNFSSTAPPLHCTMTSDSLWMISLVHIWPHRTYNRNSPAVSSLCRSQIPEKRSERPGKDSPICLAAISLIR